MRIRILLTTFVTVALVGAPAAHAQGAGGAQGGGRQAVQERRAEAREKFKNASAEERAAAVEKAKERRDARAEKLSPEQQEWAKKQGAEAARIREGVKSGTITRESAAEQLKAWREANPRPKGSRD